MARDPRLDAEGQTYLTNVVTLGKGTDLPIVLGSHEVAKLIGVIYRDTNKVGKLPVPLASKIVPPQVYYETAADWFAETFDFPARTDVIALIQKGAVDIPDFKTYLACLASLHKRQKKYALILSAQPIPKMIQVSPRALVEYGGLQPDALASWLTWRKWFYDLDNRAAQETGYLFEPILAAALGGEAKGAKNSPIKRTDDASKGRQVDCWRIVTTSKGIRKEAYEFKLRVTIAASGQGRFGEEIAFAEDCKNSGAVPILVVLDPTPNPRLSVLAENFRAAGGEAYVGQEAWLHLEREAGPTMAVFIERYVADPIRRISDFDGQLLKFGAELLQTGDIRLHIGQGESYTITRREDPDLGVEEAE